MAQITYENKVALNENPEIADINKVKDTDMNQIKDVVNENETKELIAVSGTAPSECSTGDMYFNTTDNLIYVATGTDTWSTTGTTPTENTIYVVIADKVMYMYNGSTLVKLGSADIPQQDTAPSNPKEDDLWIDTDDNTNLVGVVSSTTVSEKDTYSCNYLNQHLYDMYSTNEVLTNKIWKDGKPIYRTVIDKGDIAIPRGNGNLFEHGIQNIDQVTSCIGCIYSPSSGYMSAGTYIDGDGYKKFNADRTVVQYLGTTYMSSGYGTQKSFIIEYTKTTDSGDR